MWARALVAWESEGDIEGRFLPCAVMDGQRIMSGAKV